MKFSLFTCLLLLSFLSLSFVLQAQLFSPSVTIGVNGIYGTASAGDFDQDGDHDLLVSGRERNQPVLKLFVIENGQFFEKTNSGLPAGADGAQWIDYDGDQDLDAFVFTTGDKGTTADFYINDKGTFTPIGLVVPNLRRAKFSIVDYDEDGDIDILMAGYHGLSFPEKTFLLKNTPMGFVEIHTNLQGYHEGNFAWADFDQDGDLDVLISGSYNNTTLYMNNGGDSFSIYKSDFPSAVRGQLQWADFDDDDDLDILIVGFGNAGPIAKIFKNNGDKTFSEYTGLSLEGTEQGDSQWIDFDMDGDLDLFHSGFANGSFLRQLFKLENGIYTPVDFAIGSAAQFFMSDFTFLDYDQDEDYDVLVLNDANQIRIYRNNMKSNPYPLDNKPGWPVALTAHPLDVTALNLEWRDYGDNESAFSVEMRTLPSGTFKEIQVISGNGSGQISSTKVSALTPGTKYEFRVRALNSSGFSSYSQSVVSSPASPDLQKLPALKSLYITYSASWADMDNDGDLDLMYSGIAGADQNYIPTTIILKNNGGDIADQSHNLPPIAAHDLDWADYDADGDLDLLFSGSTAEGHAETKLLINEENFTFSEYDQSPLRGVRSGFARWVDVNNDGFSDIYLSGTYDGNNTVHVTQLLINNRDHTFEEKYDSGLPAIYQSDVELNDFNLDGMVDILIGGFKDTLNLSIRATELYLNQGDNTFALHQTFQESSDASVESGDFDLDGDADIIVAGNYDGTRIYWNDQGKFKADTQNTFFGFLQGELVTGDIDNDGDLDIVLGGNGKVLKSTIYINQGNGIFLEGFYPLAQTSYTNFSLGDFDRDNDLDLFEAGNYSVGSAFVHKNVKAIVNAKPTPPAIVKAEGIAGGIKLIWQRGTDDKTPSKSLTSNVYVKDNSGNYLFNNHADVLTGQLKKPAYGNAYLNDSIILKNLLPGTYTVGVQNIDNSFAASAFTTEEVSVSLVSPLLLSSDTSACQNAHAELKVLGNSIVWYQDENLTDSIGHGNVFRPWITSDANFYAVQKIGGVTSPSLKVRVKAHAPVTDQIVQREDSLVAPDGESFQWFRNASLLQGEEGRKLLANLPGDYTVELTRGSCTYLLSFAMRPLAPTVSYRTKLCTSEAQTLTAAGSDIRWFNKTGSQLGTGPTLTLNAVTPTDTTVFVTQTINRVSSQHTAVVWNVFEFPQSDVDLVNGSLIASDGTSYQWYLNEELIPGANKREFDVIDDGMYHAIVANHSCETISQKFLYTSIAEEESARKIFHQLPDGSVLISAGFETVSDITVFDYTGKKVLEIKDPQKSDGAYIVDTSNLRPGIFFARAYGSKSFQGKFMKW